MTKGKTRSRRRKMRRKRRKSMRKGVEVEIVENRKRETERRGERS